MVALNFDEVRLIGANRYGYQFAVGLTGGRWIGFAYALDDQGRGMIFVLPGVADGYELGKRDLREAIRMTAACALAPEQGYGGIDQWLVDEDLRGRPEEYRCDFCGVVCCDGHCRDAYEA